MKGSLTRLFNLDEYLMSEDDFNTAVAFLATADQEDYLTTLRLDHGPEVILLYRNDERPDQWFIDNVVWPLRWAGYREVKLSSFTAESLREVWKQTRRDPSRRILWLLEPPLTPTARIVGITDIQVKEDW